LLPKRPEVFGVKAGSEGDDIVLKKKTAQEKYQGWLEDEYFDSETKQELLVSPILRK
jgi:hypothetical protein